jgi:hypothetical protein
MLLEMLLEKDPTLRFQSPTQFLNALPTVMGAMDADRPITRKSLETLAALVISRSAGTSISSKS